MTEQCGLISLGNLWMLKRESRRAHWCFYSVLSLRGLTLMACSAVCGPSPLRSKCTYALFPAACSPSITPVQPLKAHNALPRACSHTHAWNTTGHFFCRAADLAGALRLSGAQLNVRLTLTSNAFWLSLVFQSNQPINIWNIWFPPEL